MVHSRAGGGRKGVGGCTRAARSAASVRGRPSPASLQPPPPGPPRPPMLPQARRRVSPPPRDEAAAPPCPPHAAPHPGEGGVRYCRPSAAASPHLQPLTQTHPPAASPGPAATLTAAPAGCGGGNVNKWGFIATSLECRVHLPLRSVPNRRGASSFSSCSSCRRRYAYSPTTATPSPGALPALAPTQHADRATRAAPQPALPNAEPFPPLPASPPPRSPLPATTKMAQQTLPSLSKRVPLPPPCGALRSSLK